MLHAHDDGRWYWFCFPCGVKYDPPYRGGGGGAVRA
jgi:hypothetical protein